MPFQKAIYKIVNYLKQNYSLDIRALSLMRIGIALIVIVDLIIRSLSIKAFFTDEGVLPLSILKLYNWNEFYFSFHALSGDLWWQIILFTLNALCAILLLIGHRTRLFTFICWLFLVSLQNRNPFILQGGDELLRLMLLWGIFLPWGERYSINKESSYKNKYFSIANIGYIILVCSVYFFSALQKTSDEWQVDRTAIYYSLSLDQIRMYFGTIIYQFPLVLKGLTFIVYYIELIAPILIILPFPKKIKIIGIASIALLHIGIASTIYVGLFYIIGLVSLIGLLPNTVIDWIELKYLKPKPIKIIKAFTYNSNFIIEFLFSLKNVSLSFIIFFCLMLNLGVLKKFPYSLDLSISKYASILRLEQNWGMFSPYVLKDDGYYVFSGFNEAKKNIDIKHNRNFVSFAKPLSVIDEFESDRWRKYSENYVFNNNNYMRPYYCTYLLKKWNKENPENKITELTIYFMKEISLPDYKTKPIEKNVVCNCNLTTTQ